MQSDLPELLGGGVVPTYIGISRNILFKLFPRIYHIAGYENLPDRKRNNLGSVLHPLNKSNELWKSAGRRPIAMKERFRD